ncbi:MAG: DNA gyrase inhibitor YacG [Oceanospirillaceae bacterium]|nr:DNA gyrase inhibitor YacG [Oceanospirillaceae bacterium]
MATKKFPCPECNTPLEWSTDNVNRPFCSERCKLLDLGSWANESYQIPAEISAEEDDYSSSMVPLENWKSPTIH